MVSRETERGMSDVRHYGSPVEQPLSAAVAPAAEVRRGEALPQDPGSPGFGCNILFVYFTRKNATYGG